MNAGCNVVVVGMKAGAHLRLYQCACSANAGVQCRSSFAGRSVHSGSANQVGLRSYPVYQPGTLHYKRLFAFPDDVSAPPDHATVAILLIGQAGLVYTMAQSTQVFSSRICLHYIVPVGSLRHISYLEVLQPRPLVPFLK